MKNAAYERIDKWISEMTLKEKISLLSRADEWSTAGIDRLGIPSVTMTDGPYGVRTLDDGKRIPVPATSFPTSLSMASSWNTELVKCVGIAIAKEAKAKGCRILLGPCVNIIRHYAFSILRNVGWDSRWL